MLIETNINRRCLNSKSYGANIVACVLDFMEFGIFVALGFRLAKLEFGVCIRVTKSQIFLLMIFSSGFCLP